MLCHSSAALAIELGAKVWFKGHYERHTAFAWNPIECPPHTHNIVTPRRCNLPRSLAARYLKVGHASAASSQVSLQPRLQRYAAVDALR